MRTDGGSRELDSGAGSALRRAGETALWSLIIALAVLVLLRAAATLRLVVLPVLLAVVLATFLVSPVRALERRGWPDGLAALAVLTVALVVFAAAFLMVIPPTVEEFGQLDVSVGDAVEDIKTWIGDSALPVSSEQVGDAIDRLRERAGEGIEAVAGPLVAGVFVAVEVLVGLLLAVVVLFFLLKDGERIWHWLLGFAPPGRRSQVHAVAVSSWDALGGFVRGQTLVALADAVLVGVALLVIGVPLVLPLAVLIFFGAYVPVIGATVTGALAALIALASGGVTAALATVIAILVVQQVEGNLLQPVLVGRAIRVHPLAVLLGITAGGVIGGILGAMIAAPLVAVCGAVLEQIRRQPQDDGGATARGVTRNQVAVRGRPSAGRQTP